MDSERKIKQDVYEMFMNRSEGDILMDALMMTGSWRELLRYAANKDYRRTRVRKMQQPRARVELVGVPRRRRRVVSVHYKFMTKMKL